MFKIQEIKIPKDKYIISTYINSGEGYKLIKEEEEWEYDTIYIPTGDSYRVLTDEEQLEEWNKFLKEYDCVFIEEIPVDKETQEKMDQITKNWHETIL
jgi:hypothetical protein